jgi:hypothetical protein
VLVAAAAASCTTGGGTGASRASTSGDATGTALAVSAPPSRPAPPLVPSTPDVPLAAVAADDLAPLGAYTRIELRANGIALDNEALVATWPDEERARVRSALPPGTPSIVQRRHQVLSLQGSALLPTRDASGLDALVPLREALGPVSMIDRMHRPPGTPSDLRLDLALHVAPTIPFDLLVSVLMTAQSTGYQRFHFAVREPSGRVADLPVLTPSGDPEAFRVASGSFCLAPIITLGATGFDVVAAIGTPYDDVIGQPTASDVRRFDAELEFMRKHAGAADKAEAPPAASQSAWRRWYKRTLLGRDRACPSVPLVAGKPDLAPLLALVREAKAAAPGCQSAYLRVPPEMPWSALAPLAAAVAHEAPHLVLLAPSRPGDVDGAECKRGLAPADLARPPR